MNDSKIRKLLIAGLVLTGGFCVGQGFAGGCVMADDMSGKEATPPKSPPPPGQLPLIEEQGKKGDPMDLARHSMPYESIIATARTQPELALLIFTGNTATLNP